MSKRTTKHTIEERYGAVTKYLSEQYSRTATSKEYGINEHTLSNWVRKYNANGMVRNFLSGKIFLISMISVPTLLR